MGLLEDLPPSYVFNDEDDAKAWEIFLAMMDGVASPEEEDFHWVLHHAEEAKFHLNRWPTVRELRAYLADKAEREKALRKNATQEDDEE